MTRNLSATAAAIARGIAATLSALATFYFILRLGGTVLRRVGLPAMVGAPVSFVLALAAGVHVARFLIRPPSTGSDVPAAVAWRRAVLTSALVTGAMFFIASIVLPLIVVPDANQKLPTGLVGLAGFVVGAIGGAAFRWWTTSSQGVIRWITAVCALVALGLAASLAVRTMRPPTGGWKHAEARATAQADSAMVVSASPLASHIGVRILRAGGNAVDAAVGVAFALAVTYPTAGNIGGGGLMLARVNGVTQALDFREVAPLASTRDMYLDDQGNPTQRSVTGALAAGVPGSVAGLWAAHEKLGVLPWRDVVQPAIDLAEQGFVTDDAFHEDLIDNVPRFTPGTVALFAPDGHQVTIGERWRNPDLARTLRLIAEHGSSGFYTGETATRLVAEMQRSGGIMSLEDLRRYEAKWRTPVEFAYRGYHVLTMPPVSSGGMTIALIAGILGGYDLRAMGWHSSDAIHVMAEAERLAYARRNTLLADPDFMPTPSSSFLSPDTATALRRGLSMTSHGEREVAPDPVRGRHTTHFSVVDAKGNAVSLTTTLNTGFGSAVAVTGAGFLLNNEMDDFSTKPGAVNQMGLRQGEANAIAPGKRMLSSMTPTIVLDSVGAPYLIVGAAGGARIITAVLQIMSNVVDFQMSIGDALAAPRFHAQDFPDRLEMSHSGYPDSVLRALSARGHHVQQMPDGGWTFGWAQGILRTGGRWAGATEPRGHGLAAGY